MFDKLAEFKCPKCGAIHTEEDWVSYTYMLETGCHSEDSYYEAFENDRGGSWWACMSCLETKIDGDKIKEEI